MKACILIRKKGGKKLRKLVLRKMIKLEKAIARHAQKHRDILDQRWDESDLSQAQARQIIDRIDSVIEVLPGTITQAQRTPLRSRKIKFGVPACQSLKNRNQKISILRQSLTGLRSLDGPILPTHL
jgi:hypothetical protein